MVIFTTFINFLMSLWKNKVTYVKYANVNGLFDIGGGDKRGRPLNCLLSLPQAETFFLWTNIICINEVTINTGSKKLHLSIHSFSDGRSHRSHVKRARLHLYCSSESILTLINFFFCFCKNKSI